MSHTINESTYYMTHYITLCTFAPSDRNGRSLTLSQLHGRDSVFSSSLPAAHHAELSGHRSGGCT